jgi:hypothetical protein
MLSAAGDEQPFFTHHATKQSTLLALALILLALFLFIVGLPPVIDCLLMMLHTSTQCASTRSLGLGLGRSSSLLPLAVARPSFALVIDR